MDQVGLWWKSATLTHFELCRDEDAAIAEAVGLVNDGWGTILGVQFPDGSVFRAAEWPAYQQRLREMKEEYDRYLAAIAIGPPVLIAYRVVEDPFEGNKAEIFADTPEWVGANV